MELDINYNTRMYVDNENVLNATQNHDPRLKIGDPGIKLVLRKMVCDVREIKQNNNDLSIQNQALANEVKKLNLKLAKSDGEINVLKQNQAQLENELKKMKCLMRKKCQDEKNSLGQCEHNGDENSSTMIAGHQWFGDGFLYELLVRYSRQSEKDNFNLFSSVFKLKKFDEFIADLLKRKRFHYNVVISIGYSELFNKEAICSSRHKIKFNNLLKHLSDNGAETIKVLSFPPAYDMSTNEDYLKNCQTTNRFLKHVVENFVQSSNVMFLNLDKFFVLDADDDFSYIKNQKICVEILDNFIMAKEKGLFHSTIDNVVTTQVVEYVVNPVWNSPSKIHARSGNVFGEKKQLNSNDVKKTNNVCGGAILNNNTIESPNFKMRKSELLSTSMTPKVAAENGECKTQTIPMSQNELIRLSLSKAFDELTKPMISKNLNLPPWAIK